MPLQKEMMLMLKSSGLGDGEPALKDKLLKSFLNVLLELDTIPARIVFSATGIFLTTEGSPVFDIIKLFENKGSEILSCTTCLEYYNRMDKLIIGKPTTMKETVAAMLSFKQVMMP